MKILKGRYSYPEEDQSYIQSLKDGTSSRLERNRKIKDILGDKNRYLAGTLDSDALILEAARRKSKSDQLGREKAEAKYRRFRDGTILAGSLIGTGLIIKKLLR